jgi:hypothetical protein
MYNHSTLDPNTLMYIDSFFYNTKETYEIKGWIYNKTGIVKDILIGKRPVISNLWLDRPDVVSVYPNASKHGMLGFHVIIDKNDLNESFSILVKDNDNIIKLKDSLLQDAIKHTGFKREHKDLIIVDDFYADPDLIRNYAMNNLNFEHSNYHKGKRSADRFILEGTKEKFEQIIGRKVTNWNHEKYANGVFQYCTSQDPIVYHVDTQTYAAMVFLTPDAPLETGTAFYKSKVTGAIEFSGEFDQEEFNKTFKGVSNELNFFDKTQYELMDTAANVYNRLVLFNAKRIHAATQYFGDAIENARFFQLFFFDVE